MTERNAKYGASDVDIKSSIKDGNILLNSTLMVLSTKNWFKMSKNIVQFTKINEKYTKYTKEV